MKMKIMIAALVLSVANIAMAQGSLTPDLVKMIPDRAFVPPGFDSNDQAQVVIAGEFPNTCFKSGPAETKVDLVNKKISITHYAYFYSSCWCLQTLVPYSETINVGVLPKGTFDIVLIDRSAKEHPFGQLSVAEAASNAPDDFVYSSVDQTYFDKSIPNHPFLTLSGSLPGDCATIKEIKVLYRAKNVVEVLPMVDVKQDPGCTLKATPFETRVELAPPWTGLSLIHIRSLNGRAINKVVEF